MNPKRRFFQIHLSTAVVLMLVAGVLVWANVRESFSTEVEDNATLFKVFGWPFTYSSQKVGFSFVHVTDEFVCFPFRLSRKNALFNALIALAILLSVWAACEWRIRRSTDE